MKPTEPANAATDAVEPALFSPIALRSVELANRIVYSPMGQYMADRTGAATDWHKIHLGMMALSGAGLIFTEASAVAPLGRDAPTSLGLWTDAHEEALAGVIEPATDTRGEARHPALARQPGSMDIPGMAGGNCGGGGGWRRSPIAFPDRTSRLTVPTAGELDEIAGDSFVIQAGLFGYDLLKSTARTATCCTRSW